MKREYLFVLGGMLLTAIIFSTIQLIQASPAVPNPGHSWNQMECDTNLCITGGNVGIGTTEPSEKLQVVGNIKLGGTEGDIKDVNAIIGYNDLILQSDSTKNKEVYILGSRLSFRPGDVEKWNIDSTGTLTVGSVPWARLTSFPAACGAGEYVTGVGSSLACSTPPGVTWPLLSTIDGTAAAPALSFSADTDTGLFRPAADALAFSTAGSERMRIDSAGNVGIGTTSPGAKLEVAGQVKITGGSPDTGKVLTSDATGLATWQSLAYIRPMRAGTAAPEVWYTAPNTGTALTTGAPSANVLRAIPFIVSRTITLDRIAINVATAVAGSARLGIYTDGGNLYPGSRVLDAGTVDTGTTGVKAITISQTLSPGLYWLVIVSNAAPTIGAFTVGSLIPILGYGSALGTAGSFGYSVSFTYAALPATFPAGASLITATPIPAIFVRLSS